MSVGRERRKFEDTKGIIRNCKSKKDRQYNGQKRKDRRKTDNTMAKRERTEERQITQWPKEKRQ